MKKKFRIHVQKSIIIRPAPLLLPRDDLPQAVLKLCPEINNQPPDAALLHRDDLLLMLISVKKRKRMDWIPVWLMV
jgi:hypothetical protein